MAQGRVEGGENIKSRKEEKRVGGENLENWQNAVL